MRKARLFYWGMSAAGIAVVLAASAVQLGGPALSEAEGQQKSSTAVRIDNDDIGGVVTSANGAEAGVWVIAETTDLPTKFAKVVVTDDQGRYVIPDLPKANYSVWVRGYGLVDSPKVRAIPGKILNLKAVAAPTAAAAAEYYPAIHWYSMLKIPDKTRVPRHRAQRQRHAGEAEKPGRVAGRRQISWLHIVSPTGQQADAHDFQGVGRVQILFGSVAAARPLRTSQRSDDAQSR